MKIKTKSRKYKKNRGYKKKPKIPRNNMTSKLGGFPPSLVFTHKYTEQLNLTDAGSAQHYLHSCNSLYDPNYTGTGTQPLYFDQMAGIYDHYTVIGSKIRYTIVPANTTAQEPYKIVTWINDDGTTVPSVDVCAQQRGAKIKLCAGGINPDKLILTQTWSAKKMFGNPLGNDELKGTPTSSPAEQSFYQITFRSLDGVSTVEVWVYVEITYIALWRELKDVAGS